MTTQPNSGDLKQLHHSNLLQKRQKEDLIHANDITPMPTGVERMAALRDLGATFEEGQKSIAKVATPTETIVPSFVDSNQLETILKKQKDIH